MTELELSRPHQGPAAAASRAVQACSPTVPGHSDTLTSHPGRGWSFSKDLGQSGKQAGQQASKLASQQVQSAISPALILRPLCGHHTQTKTQAMSFKRLAQTFVHKSVRCMQHTCV